MKKKTQDKIQDTVKKGLQLMDSNNGELWGKLDAGTDAYFKRIAQTRVPFEKILDNLLTTSQQRPIKIQSCFINMDGQMPDIAELGVYSERVNHMLTNGGLINAIQLYTIARPPMNPRGYDLSPLTGGQMDQVAQTLQGNIPVPIETYR